MTLNCAIFSFLAAKSFIAKNIIYQDKGLMIFEARGTRCLTFGKVKEGYNLQGCISKNNPQLLVFDYTKFMIGSLLFNPSPNQILILGLGIGSIPIALSRILPNSQIDIVEIDNRLPEIAEKYFEFNKTDRMNIYIEDGYQFLMNTKKKYDMIFMDIFDETYIPKIFLTEQFIQRTKDSLTENGIFIMNTFTTSPTYADEENLINKIFDKFLQIISSNRVIITGINFPEMKGAEKSEKNLRFALQKNGINSKVLLKLLNDDFNKRYNRKDNN